MRPRQIQSKVAALDGAVHNAWIRRNYSTPTHEVWQAVLLPEPSRRLALPTHLGQISLHFPGVIFGRKEPVRLQGLHVDTAMIDTGNGGGQTGLSEAGLNWTDNRTDRQRFLWLAGSMLDAALSRDKRSHLPFTIDEELADRVVVPPLPEIATNEDSYFYDFVREIGCPPGQLNPTDPIEFAVTTLAKARYYAHSLAQA